VGDEPDGNRRDKPGGSPAKRDAEAQPEMDEQEILQRVLKNSRTSEERLANKEVNDGTKQVQRDILSDLDKLIELSQRQQDQDDKDSNQKHRQPAAGGPESAAGRHVEQAGREQRRKQRQQQARQQGGQPQPGDPTKEPGNEGTSRATAARAAARPEAYRRPPRPLGPPRREGAAQDE